MSFSDVCRVIGFADSGALSVADAWLAELELSASASRLLATFEARKSRRTRRMLVQGVK